MKKILTLLISLFVMFTVASPCFCDENDVVYVDFPDVSDIVDEFEYTGKEITYEIPKSNYYIIAGNVQTEVGEYVVSVYLSRQSYRWEDGSDRSLTYYFKINKADYDLSNVIFEDKAYIADGNAYSLHAKNLPDSIEVTYNSENVSEAGNYQIIAMLQSDNNHNPVENISANLYLLEKSNEEIYFETSIGIVRGQLPTQADMDCHYLKDTNAKYKEVVDYLLENSKVKKENIVNVVETKLSYNGISIDTHEEVSYSITNNEEDNIVAYAINSDDNGNLSYTKLKTKTTSNYITFVGDVSSSYVLVKTKLNYFIYAGIGLLVLLIIAVIVLLIIRARKKRSNNPDTYRKQRVKKEKKTNKKSNNKSSNKSMYRRAD